MRITKINCTIDGEKVEYESRDIKAWVMKTIMLVWIYLKRS